MSIMTLTINAASMPTGWKPDSRYYRFEYPEPQANDGLGNPCRAIGKPWAQIGMEIMPRSVLAWFQAYFSDSTATYVDVTVVGLFDPRENTTNTYTAKMHRPKWDAILPGYVYQAVSIMFTDLVKQ